MTQPSRETTDPTRWPKPYLLQLYKEAIAAGCIRVGPIDRVSAKSLTQSFFRFRRRKDKSVASFVEPEFQLVGVSRWTPDHGGCIYIIYNSMPESQQLPGFMAVSMDEVTTLSDPAEESAGLPPDLVLNTDEINPEDFVESLRKESAAKSGKPQEDIG